jgi:small-conductance mechanosensitive channel
VSSENSFSSTDSLINKTLFTISGKEVSLFWIGLFLVVIICTVLVSKAVQRTLSKTLQKRFLNREGTLAALLRLLHYLVLIAGFFIGLQLIGINLSALFADGAVFAVGLGFAMQNVVQNFVAGVILLLERSIKPGDVLEIDGTIVKVMDMGIRTTIARTLVDEELIMPNSKFSQSTVKNYTLHDSIYCLGVVVGVSYDSDMHQVIRVLEKTATELTWRLLEPAPAVILQDFGSSSVDFGVYVSIDDPWQQRAFRSELRKDIWFAFKDSGIMIAYPQLDVHFDSVNTETIIDNLKK